jgi:hypothetical protein
MLMASDFESSLMNDPEKALMLMVIKRLNKMSKLSFENKMPESDVCVLVEKWTDALLWDFGIDLVVNDVDEQITETIEEIKDKKDDCLPKTFGPLD